MSRSPFVGAVLGKPFTQSKKKEVSSSYRRVQSLDPTCVAAVRGFSE